MHKSLPKRIFGSEKIRFGAVGSINTAIDFVLLFLFSVVIGIPTIIANIGSTSCALTVSYLLNKKAVFRNTDSHNHRQVILFLVVTLAGLWIVQGVVIAISSPLLQMIGLNDATVLLLAKLIATAFTLVWNYLWYSRVVFRQQNNA